jgi:NAD(P)H-hydrate epimerase
VRAHHTVTFALPKLGLVTSPGFTFAGTIHVADIGIPPSLARVKRELLDDGCLAALRAPRDPTGHKGTYGHALIVAGSAGKTGAALLAAQACARAGAGLVTLVSEAEEALAGRVVEVMTEPISALPSLLPGKRAVAFGPGVRRAPSLRAVLDHLLETWDGPLVIDAEGLNLLAQDLAPLGATRARVILTPHPAEMGRLARADRDEVQADRVGVAEAFAAAHRCIVVLKGARTVIASPDRTAINPTGNPGMGSGGTGDVLTGVIAALCAQGMEPFDAACAGAYLHGRAGDLAAAERGEAGLLARDLVEKLPVARR